MPMEICNEIGETLANRIIRAAKELETFKPLVAMPSRTVYPGGINSAMAFLDHQLAMKGDYHSFKRGWLWSTLLSLLTTKSSTKHGTSVML